MILRLILCANVTVAVEAAVLDYPLWLALNVGCALAVAGVLIMRREASR